MKESADKAFASEAMGKGFVVIPSSNQVLSPIDGKVVSLFKTNHAIGILGNDGEEILIHIGIDTVDLNGKYFKSFVKQGDRISKGQLLIEFDRKSIEDSGYNDQVMVIITNTNSYQNISLLNIKKASDLNTPVLQLMV